MLRVASALVTSVLAASGGRAGIVFTATTHVVVREVSVDLVPVSIRNSLSSTVSAASSAASGSALLTTAPVAGTGSGAGEALRVTPLTFPLPLRLTWLVRTRRHLLHDVQRHLCIDVGIRVYRVGGPAGQEGLLHPVPVTAGVVYCPAYRTVY